MKACEPRWAWGLTLIELLVALSILSVLSVISYRALATASSSQVRLDADFLRWNALARSMQRIEAELTEVLVVPPAKDAAPLPAIELQLPKEGSGGEFRFLRLDAERGVRLVGFRLREQHLEWLLWEGRDALGTPAVEPLLDEVRAVRWQFMLDGRRYDTWPVAGQPADRLPAAVVVELELPDLGSFHRIFALR